MFHPELIEQKEIDDYNARMTGTLRQDQCKSEPAGDLYFCKMLVLQCHSEARLVRSPSSSVGCLNHHHTPHTIRLCSAGPGPPSPYWGHNNLPALPQQQQLQLLLFCAPITLNLNPLQLIERREKGDLPAYFCAWELSTEGGGWEQYWLRLWL